MLPEEGEPLAEVLEQLRRGVVVVVVLRADFARVEIGYGGVAPIHVKRLVIGLARKQTEIKSVIDVAAHSPTRRWEARPSPTDRYRSLLQPRCRNATT